MAVTPESLDQLIRLPYLKNIENEIDEKLKDPNFVKSMRFGTSEDPYYRIVIPGSLLEGEKKELAIRYENTGWSRVAVSNTSDVSGERAGFISITMYKNPPNNFLIDK